MAFWKKILQGEKKDAAVPDASVPVSAAPALTPGKSAPPIHGKDAFFAPVMTEKASAAAAAGQYVFAVSRDVTKPAFARAVSRRYGVDVASVRMALVPGKERRRGRVIGWKPGFKKAVVTLKKGQAIEMQ